MRLETLARTRKAKLTLTCAGCTALVLVMHLVFAPYVGLEQRTQDWLTTNFAAAKSPRNPALIYLGIDEASVSLDTLFDDDLAKSPTLRLMKAGWPWNRAVYAAVVDRLAEAGAKAVVFDILFPGPRAGDATFKAALDRYADRVAIGSNLETRSEDNDAAGGGNRNHKPTYIPPVASLIPRTSPSDSRTGFVNVYADADGKVRRTHFRTSLLEFFNLPPIAGSEELYSLPARALQKAGLDDLVPPGRRPVMFRFSEEILPRSMHEIFVEDQWQRPPYNGGALFKDKIVLVGAAGNQSDDRLQTPHGIELGPTIHLSALNAALNRDFLHETPRWLDLIFVVGAGALAWLLGARVRKPLLRLLALALALGGYYVAVQLLFNTTGFYPLLLSPMLALGFSGITWSVLEQVLDRLEKARLRRTFERYVSRDVVKELVDNPQGWLNTLGGQRKRVTVLFSDVRGFTSITESGDEQALVTQLNEYFDAMVNIVFAHDGTLDKFIGDAVMAQWGGIVTAGEKEDACRAVAAAIAMRDAVARLNPGWIARGMVEIKFGIGINQGDAIVGNLGAEVKKEVTVIGDAVNTASRFEGMTKQFHVDLLIGENVANLVCDRFLIRSVALTQPKGKTKPVDVFTVIGERSPDIAEPAWLAAYEDGVRHFRAREFEAAIPCFQAALSENPGDWLCEHYYLGQCRDLTANPPPADWTPVDVMTSK